MNMRFKMLQVVKHDIIYHLKVEDQKMSKSVAFGYNCELNLPICPCVKYYFPHLCGTSSYPFLFTRHSYFSPALFDLPLINLFNKRIEMIANHM